MCFNSVRSILFDRKSYRLELLGAEAVKDYQKLEHDIIRLAGGADNIARILILYYTEDIQR